MIYEMYIPGEVIPQHRPRFVRTGKFVRTYKTASDSNYRNKLYLEARRRGIKCFEPEIALGLQVLVERQVLKSFSKTKREKALNGELRPITRPDIDNYIKQVLDGLNGVVWADDAQITEITAKKIYAKQSGLRLRIFRVL